LYPCLTKHQAMKAHGGSGDIALTEHHAMKAYWGVEVQLHPFFDLGTRRRCWTEL